MDQQDRSSETGRGGSFKTTPLSLDDLREGTLVTPNIRLVRLLGRGGMGAVWVADHLSLDTEVAVKFIAPDLIKRNPKMVQRFEREARLAAKIKSPHAVQTYDHGVTASGTPYIVMELLEGETLKEKIKRQGALSLREVQLVMGQAAEVLGRAHALGVVHRDIKPDNVFCVETGYELFIKILDFGIAKERGAEGQHQMTSTGAMMGTPTYMSPEQVQSAKDADHRADLWALAVTIYEALLGRVPFGGETLGALCIAIASGNFQPPSAVRPDLGTAFDTWFARAFFYDADQRFQSVQEMAEAFAQAASQVGEERPSLVHEALRGAPTNTGGGAVATNTGASDGEPATQAFPAAAAPSSALAPAAAPAAAPGTFAGAAASLEPYEPPQSNAGKVVALLLILGGIGAAGVVGVMMLTGDDELSASPATAGSSAPAVASGADEEPSAVVSAEPAASTAAEPASSASAGPSASAVAAPPTAPPAFPTSKAPPTPTPRVTTTKPPAPKVNCRGDNALILVNGKLKVRPECR